MVIGQIDTSFIQKKEKSSFQEKKCFIKDYQPQSSPINDSTYIGTNSSSINKNASLKSVSEQCDQFNISDRAASSLTNAVFKDFRFNSVEINRSKIRRERSKSRLESEQNLSGIQALYFDGRNDMTLTYENKKIITKSEEHITMILEPGSRYIGHTTPLKPTSKSIKESMVDFFNTSSSNLDELKIIGCDGTAVNTGPVGGIIRLMEEELGRPLQWAICLLHCLELPLRHVFKFLDGRTQGPNSYSGEVGKMLIDCEKLPIQNFQRIQCDIVDFSSDNLSNDQAYLYDILKGVSSGTISDSLANRSPGKLNHARWITTASRIIRAYVCAQAPNEKLVVLAKFICSFYGPLWFEIKVNDGLCFGSQHFLSMVKRTKNLSDDIKPVVQSCLQRNSFFCHSESIILSLLCDTHPETREKGFKLYEVASESCPLIRKFTLPKVNFDAETLLELLDPCSLWSPPPALCGFSTNEVRENSHTNALFDFCNSFPCHSQAVERAVKLVSQSSKTACGFERRHGVIKNIICARKKLIVRY